MDDLLQLARLESDPGGAARKPVAVAAMLRSIEVEARGLGAGAHEVTLDAAEDVTLLGDHGELYSAFSNIVFNAVRYTPAGGRIDIRWALEEEEGAGAALSVTDTGIGIDARHIPRLTERFYRVDKARSRDSGGTGLGLAIVKHVLVRHGAELRVQSEPGAGSTFSVHFEPERVRVCQPEASVTAG